MDIFQAIILGIIQGITEWLPISSEAMVTLAGRFLFDHGYQEALGTAIWLHTGTTIAAIIYFREEIIDIVKSAYTKSNKDLLIFLMITTIISGIVGFSFLIFLFNFIIPDEIFTTVIGIFLIGISYLQKKASAGKLTEIKPIKAVAVGIAQGFSILPGISRSGITIVTLLMEKYNLKQSLKLSFLMSIPVTFGAGILLPVIKEGFVISIPLIIGSLVAALVGFVTIKNLMKFAEKTNFSKATLILGLIITIIGIISIILQAV
ncbi:undecaprenyl-diphosphate phosphatase [Candidatus Micrarchaeota archaeon]|nr:undecaprenyl-diphosphate phosphatase [Candidatus Micrarchaeota archaeon]